MASSAVYRVQQKKCATCAYWEGKRTIEFGANKPRYIKADAGNFSCMAQSGRQISANNYCPKFSEWEKLMFN